MSSSDVQSADELHEELLADKIDLFRERLRESNTYLGNANILEKVTWIESNRGHRLVLSDAVDLLTQSSEDNDTKEDKPNPTEIPSAELSIIARISHDDCWLAPDGFWKGRTRITPTFADLKLSCAAEAPGYAEFDDEFGQALHNLEAIVDARRTPEVDTMKGLFITSGSQKGPKIKIRHPVFTVRQTYFPQCLEPYVVYSENLDGINVGMPVLLPIKVSVTVRLLAFTDSDNI
jgi:hypothetical protein